MWELFIGTVGSLLGNWSDSGLRILHKNGLPTFYQKYVSDLRRLLQGMPFIYQDLKLEVLSDFVDTELHTINARTNKPNALRNDAFIQKKATEKIHDHPRGLILGGGGIGKTTFLRYLALTAIRRKSDVERMFVRQKITPIFISLKAINTSINYPLASAMYGNHTYFSGRLGKRRLLNLARSRRVLLLLDGLDEVQRSGGIGSLGIEIGTLFGSLDEPIAESLSNSEHGTLYRELRNCRVYLSSRPQFFRSSGLAISEHVPQWELAGLTSLDDQEILVGNIFRNYIQRDADFYGDKLDSRIFRQEMESSSDDGFIELAKKPLFLTVMVFVYVSEILQGKPRGTLFRGSSNDLVFRATKLLVYEIDRFKTTEIRSHFKRQAAAGRRGRNPEEKIEFLGYVAEKFTLDGSNVISERCLRRAALEHFSKKESNSERLEIMVRLRRAEKNLDEGLPTLGDLVSELLECGIFIPVSGSGGSILYDFPHRRFRECLAEAKLLRESEGSCGDRLLRDDSLHDLFVSSVRGDVEKWKRLVENTARSVRYDLGDAALWRLLGRLLEDSPTIEKSDEVRRDLLDSVCVGDVGGKISRECLDVLRISADLALHVSTSVGKCLNEGAYDRAIVLTSLLERAGMRQAIEDVADRQVALAHSDLMSGLILLRFLTGKALGRLTKSLVSKFMREMFDPVVIAGICVFGFWGKTREDEEILRSALSSCLLEIEPSLAGEFADRKRFEMLMVNFKNDRRFDVGNVPTRIWFSQAPLVPNPWSD